MKGKYSRPRFRFLLSAGLALLFVSGCSVRLGPHHKRAQAEKVLVCHKGKKTLSISRQAVDAHLKHGDYLGACY